MDEEEVHTGNNLKWRVLFMRVAYLNYLQYDDEMEYLFPESHPGLLFDIFLWCFRDLKGNELDIIGRLRHHEKKPFKWYR